VIKVMNGKLIYIVEIKDMVVQFVKVDKQGTQVERRKL